MWRIVLQSLLAWAYPAVAAAAEPVDFRNEIQPLLARHCTGCHGVEKQRGGLRLDRKADAFAGGNSGAVLRPGKPDLSPLLHRVQALDADIRMPPKGDRLHAAEQELLKAWIAQGAPWPDDGSHAGKPAWWSFAELKRPPLPDSGSKHPIDAFVRAKLAEKKLQAAPEADRRTLIRRLYFDLIGLPPSPEAVEAFVHDTRPEAYEKQVDQLLASRHYGERWARHWLDVVHFGETHGYDKDKPRPNAWPYRDYVIRALNEDKPYARFVQEQIAGDVLFPGTVDGIEALGFLAAGPWDFIAHVELPESKRDGQIARHLDRDDYVANTMSTFLGLTAHCAQCHNHKFDPITQVDYYRLQAVFAAIDRTDRTYDTDPKVAARRLELETTRQRVQVAITQLEASARVRGGTELAGAEVKLAQAVQTQAGLRPPEYGYHSAISPRADSTKWVQVDLGQSFKLDRVVLRPCYDDFNAIGAGFGFPVRFQIAISEDVDFTKAHVIADETRADVRNPGLKPYAADAGGQTARYIRVTVMKLTPRQNDFIFALAELEARGVDGKNLAAGQPVTALDSIEAGPRWRKSNLTDGRFPPEPSATLEEIKALTQQVAKLRNAALGEVDAKQLQALTAEASALDIELNRLAGTRRTAYIGGIHTGSGNFTGTGSQGGKPRPIHVLARGDVTRPGQEVSPGAIAAFPDYGNFFKLPAQHTEGDRRAALARWITHPTHPLPWRVMANRVWQYHFGRGLVDTPNDFGRMGQLPSHPELLDYLATDLREHQSLKKLHKLIVTSATYKQSSQSRPAEAQVDAENRLLWRQNRRKLEAEAVRDAILSVAGKLDLTAGGPSFQDFVIEKPEHSPHYQYHLHDPEDARSHRRAVYRFVVRSKSNPFMAALDCADPSLAVEKRNETLSPQQALALLNNKLALAMARHFAARVTKLGTTDAERIQAAVRLALGREPSRVELEALTAHAQSYGLAAACRVLFNLNEFVFVD